MNQVKVFFHNRTRNNGKNEMCSSLSLKIQKIIIFDDDDDYNNLGVWTIFFPVESGNFG